MLSRSVVALVLVAAAAPASAERTVAMTPLSTLGSEDKSAATKKLLVQIEQAIAAVPGVKLMPAAQVTSAIEKAKKPQLKQCEGEPACLVELGKLIGAQTVVTGELGGLGDAQVVYLGAIDVDGAKEPRSTVLSIGGDGADDSPAGAAVRLLDPERYTGSVKFTMDVPGTTVLVNGTRVKLDGQHQLVLPVGTHAVTVTHPQYHNFVKFVEVSYGKTTAVAVDMKQYPIVERSIQGQTARGPDTIEYVDPPLWRRWYVAGPAIVVLAVGAGLIAGWLAYDFPDYDNCRRIGGGGCFK